MPFQGSQAIWRVAVRRVALSSILTTPGTTVDVLVETYPDTVEESGHVFYLTDVFTKDPTVFAFSDSSGIEAPGVFGPHVYVGHYRKFVAGPPAKWEVYLRFTNLTNFAAPPLVTPTEVFYEMYRWVGLS